MKRYTNYRTCIGLFKSLLAVKIPFMVIVSGISQFITGKQSELISLRAQYKNYDGGMKREEDRDFLEIITLEIKT